MRIVNSLLEKNLGLGELTDLHFFHSRFETNILKKVIEYLSMDNIGNGGFRLEDRPLVIS
jgi:hypothetical protein